MRAEVVLIMVADPVVPVIPKLCRLPLVLNAIAEIQEVMGEVAVGDMINQTGPCQSTWAFVTIKNI
jgi:hypothetical protein